MSDKKYNIKKVGFPNPLSPDSVKKTKGFGLSVGEAIQSEWFRRSNGDCRYYNNRAKYHTLRLYARGEQSIQKYKSELAVNGDLSHTNIDWTPVPIIPKFVDIIVNGMESRLYSVKTTAVDKVASERRNSYIVEMEKDMIGKDLLMEGKETLGVDAFANNPSTLPETSEELEVHMQLNYKQGIEIAEEEAIANIMQANRYDDIKKRVDYDLTVLGVGFAKHSFNTIEGVKLEYVDPADVVYSYTESPYFDDCYYFGEVKRVPLSELKKINPSLSKEEIEEIKNNSSNWNDYHRYDRVDRESQSEFEDHTVNLLYFNYKTTKNLVYKKKKNKRGGDNIIEKDSDWNPPKEKLRDSERIVKEIDVWYEGVMVLGTNIMLKWELCKNMIRRKSATHETLPNYVGVAPRNYNGRTESTVDRMMTFGDLIQLVHLKLQLVVARIVPDGVFIDADGLNEVDLGDGNAYNPKKALELYFQTGSVIGRSLTMEGEYNHAKVPIQELSHSGGGHKIKNLIETYNYYLQMIRDVTGLNEARDASMPDSDTLVGVQKLAALNSNTATRHILNGGLYITEKMAECISYRISDIIQNPEMKKQFTSAIGRSNIAILEDLQKVHLHDFGIYIELSPDEEEKALLENNIQQALSKDQIFLEDAIDVRQIQNLKLANQVLKIRRRKKHKEDIERDQARIDSQTQSAIATNESKAQFEAQKIQMEAEAQMTIDKNLKDLEARNSRIEMEAQRELMNEELRINLILKGQEAEISKFKEETKQDRMDNRVRIQGTQTSMENKRKELGGEPIDFESNHDSLGGFNLSEYNPK